MIVATYKARNCATVRVADDCIAPHGSDDEARIIADQCRAARDILHGWAIRHVQKQEPAHYGLTAPCADSRVDYSAFSSGSVGPFSASYDSTA